MDIFFSDKLSIISSMLMIIVFCNWVEDGRKAGSSLIYIYICGLTILLQYIAWQKYQITWIRFRTLTIGEIFLGLFFCIATEVLGKSCAERSKKVIKYVRNLKTDNTNEAGGFEEARKISENIEDYLLRSKDRHRKIDLHLQNSSPRSTKRLNPRL